MGMRANGRWASIVAAGLLIGLGVPAQASCAGGDCAPAAAASERAKEQAGKPVALSKFTKRTARHSTAARKFTQKKYATKRAAKYARVAARVQKAGKRFTVAAAVAPKAVTPESLKPSIANARAEMSENEVRAAGLLVDNPAPAEAQLPAVIEVAATELNDIDRAASTNDPAPKVTAQRIGYDQRQVTASNTDTWDQTSLIGKIFVAFGGLLTLASAARLFIA